MGLTKPRASQIFDIDYKQATRVITVSNVTLTGGAPSVVDGVSLTAGDRVLVTGQSTGSENGLYAVAVVGVGSDGTWVRTSDGNEDGEIQAGMIVMVTEGTTYHDTQWKLTTDGTIDIGTTALVFELNTSGNSITNGTSNITVLNNANVNVNVTGSQVAAFASTGTYVTGLVSATGNITTAGTVNAGSISATGASNIGDMNVAAASAIDFNTSVIGNIGTPVADTDAATKAYVDGSLSTSGFSISDGVTTETIEASDTIVFEGATNITVLVNQVSGTESNVAVSLNDDVVIGNSLSVTGNVSAGNVDGTRANFTNLVGTLDTAAQTNITSVGTLTSVTASGNITTTGDININARQGLYLHDSDSSHYVAIVPPATVAGNVTFVLPGDAGTSDYVLSTNGAGTLSWIEQSGGGSSGASSFPNSTVTPLPSSEGNFDLSYNYAQTTQETPFESGGTDAFGVSLGEVYSMMDPAGDIPTPTDLGILA